jgi:multidrug resistance efflux pump
MAEPHDSRPALQHLENETGRVEREIAGVEEQITHAAAQIEKSGGPGAGDNARYWMKEKEQLRREKEQLRRKEELLLEGAILFPCMLHKVAHSDRNIERCPVLLIAWQRI